MSHVKRGSNLKFLAKCMWQNPGESSMFFRRCLALHNGKVWRSGLYCWYFNSLRVTRAWGFTTRQAGADLGLWQKKDFGDGCSHWHLTVKGCALAAQC